MGFLPFLSASDRTTIFHLPEEAKKRRSETHTRAKKKHTKEECQKVEFTKNSLLRYGYCEEAVFLLLCAARPFVWLFEVHIVVRLSSRHALQLRQTSCFIIGKLLKRTNNLAVRWMKVLHHQSSSGAGQSQQDDCLPMWLRRDPCSRPISFARSRLRGTRGRRAQKEQERMEEVIFHQNKFHSITAAKSVNQSKSPFVAFSLQHAQGKKSVSANLAGILEF